MVRGSALLVLVAVATLTGCAETRVLPAPSSARSNADLDTWLQAGEPAGAPASRLLSPLAQGPVSIPAPVPAPPRPRLGRQVDIQFQRAEIKNALQFLAEAGDFNLVVEDSLSGQVSARLHGVDPYDALVSLAEANGATVRYDRRIVTVRHR